MSFDITNLPLEIYVKLFDNEFTNTRKERCKTLTGLISLSLTCKTLYERLGNNNKFWKTIFTSLLSKSKYYSEMSYSDFGIENPVPKLLSTNCCIKSLEKDWKYNVIKRRIDLPCDDPDSLAIYCVLKTEDFEYGNKKIVIKGKIASESGCYLEETSEYKLDMVIDFRYSDKFGVLDWRHPLRTIRCYYLIDKRKGKKIPLCNFAIADVKISMKPFQEEIVRKTYDEYFQESYNEGHYSSAYGPKVFCIDHFKIYLTFNGFFEQFF